MAQNLLTKTFEALDNHFFESDYLLGDDESETELEVSDDEELTARRRGKAKINDLFKTYSDFKSAKEALDNDNDEDNLMYNEMKWRPAIIKMTNDGQRRNYKCIKGCPKALYLLLRAESLLTDIFISEDEHIHDTKVTKLPAATRKFIEKLYVDGIRKPTDILRKIKPII
jgi:hypothetical protein